MSRDTQKPNRHEVKAVEIDAASREIIEGDHDKGDEKTAKLRAVSEQRDADQTLNDTIRPNTRNGRGQVCHSRISGDLLEQLDAWAAKEHISRSEAIARLVGVPLKTEQ